MTNHSKFAAAAGAIAALATAALLAGCGAGSYGGGSAMDPGPVPNPSPSPTQASGPLSTAMLKGSPGFVNAAGHTVYVFDADLAQPGQSTCNGACAQNWPPVAAAGALPAPWTAIVRQDTSRQLAYKGRPLYTFIADAAPGQTNGDGINAFGGLWHIARP